MKQETIYSYFRGEASTEEEKQLLDWIEESDDNRRFFRNERMMYDVSLFSETMPSRRGGIFRRLVPVLRWSARIAAMFIVVFSSVQLLDNVFDTKKQGVQTITVPAGQRAEITLADGTHVWLNSKSTLTYAADFGSEERNVTLDGEAYFDVTANKKLPFYVHTQHNNVRVVGTSFNVCAYNGTNEFETSLIEGIVDVYRKNATQALTRLEKNQYLVIKGDSYKKGNICSIEFLRWREGLYCFDDLPFSNLLKRLELYYAVNIQVTNPKLLDYHCTGKFKEQDGVEHILKSIQRDHNFAYRINEEKDSIIIK